MMENDLGKEQPTGGATADYEEEYIEAPIAKYVDENDENVVRGNWTGKLDFILSCLSYAVGLGNVWRFPYQCYKNGGGAFVLPFLIMLGLTGIPLFFLESAFGQYASSGVISIWNASPIFVGIGVAMFAVSFFVSLYYNVIIAWAFFYLFESFTSPLPWATCDNEWNTNACRVRAGRAFRTECTFQNGTWFNQTCFTANNTEPGLYEQVLGLINATVVNGTATAIDITKSPSDEYFHNHVLAISGGFSDMGLPRWKLVLYLLLSWLVICLCMIKGIKSSGRAVYFTATFPYLVLLILLVRGVTLPGSMQGILYYVTPKWNMLLKGKVWGDAAVQIFFSLAPGWGGLITLSSYNKFKNNCLRDTYIVCIGDVITSLFAGLVIFAIIGYMAHDLGVDVDKVADEGAGLAFIVYPEVVTRLPASPLWAILFFLMLITLGLGTQFAIVNTVHTTIIDTFPQQFRHGHRPSFVMIALCLISFLLGLTCVCRGGMYMLQLMDSYAASYSVLFIALTECLALSWVYGYDQLVADVKLMLGIHIGIYWKLTWKYLSPAALIAILVFLIVEFQPTKYGTYIFPWWADMMGWCLSLASVICIPAGVIYKILTADPKLTVIERFKVLSRPTDDWGPALFRSTSMKKIRHTSGGSISLRFRHPSGVSIPESAVPLKSVEATIEIPPPPSYSDTVASDNVVLIKANPDGTGNSNTTRV